MKKTLVVIVCVLMAFWVQFVSFNFVGRWFTPDFLLLVVLFFNFYSGIRYSLVAALTSGILLDSYSTTPFGIYSSSFVLCAFMATLAKRYLFHTHPYSMRILITFLMTMLNVIVLYVLHTMFISLEIKDFLKAIVIPQVFTTTLICNFVYQNLKKCVLKFSV